jgi:hypothetical protein
MSIFEVEPCGSVENATRLYFFLYIHTEVIMNKKQLLSITMLLSIVAPVTASGPKVVAEVVAEALPEAALVVTEVAPKVAEVVADSALMVESKIAAVQTGLVGLFGGGSVIAENVIANGKAEAAKKALAASWINPTRDAQVLKAVNGTTMTSAAVAAGVYGLTDLGLSQTRLQERPWAKTAANTTVAAASAAAAYKFLPALGGTGTYAAVLAGKALYNPAGTKQSIKDAYKNIGLNWTTAGNVATVAALAGAPWYAPMVLPFVKTASDYVVGTSLKTKIIGGAGASTVGLGVYFRNAITGLFTSTEKTETPVAEDTVKADLAKAISVAKATTVVKCNSHLFNISTTGLNYKPAFGGLDKVAQVTALKELANYLDQGQVAEAVIAPQVKALIAAA